MTLLRSTLIRLVCVILPVAANADPVQSQYSLDATKSDPKMIGWMQGFPPPPEKLIMQPESDFFSFPKIRWTVCHIRELMPTKQVSRGIDSPIPLSYKLMDDIDSLAFIPIGGDQSMTWKESLLANYTDGILVLHRGSIVYEKYFGVLDETGKHAAMSMTKSMTGLLAEILVAEGTLDENATVASIVPELQQSAFGDATVRQVMDMTTALNYSEDYSDPEADIWIYSKAASPLPKPKEYEGQMDTLNTCRPYKRKALTEQHSDIRRLTQTRSDGSFHGPPEKI